MTTPRAREDGLFTHPLGAELMVYDPGDAVFHHLNAVAALVWQNCDGTKTVGELARLTQGRDGPEEIERTWEVLEKLSSAKLLIDFERKREDGVYSRRDFVGNAVALSGSLVAAAVTTIVAPKVAHAQSSCSLIACPTP